MAGHKIKILFFASCPEEEDPLRLDEEMRAIEQKINASEHRESLDLVSRWATRPDDLLQHLNTHKPTVVHFSGHGSIVGELVLMDDSRHAKPVSPAALKALFRVLKDNIRLVVMNACYSQIQAKSISEVIDCVIGMNDSIGDEAAIKFSLSFYSAIGFGRSVKEAFEQSKVSLMLEGISEENTPELFVRSSVDASTVYLVHGALLSQRGNVPETSTVETAFSQVDCVLDYGVASEIPVNESREVISMIRSEGADGLVALLERDAASHSATSYTTRSSDVRSIPFKMYFPVVKPSGQGDSIKVQVELSAPGLDVSDSPTILKMRKPPETPPLTFLVRSEHQGKQTIKVKVTCDDEALISVLLRTDFVQHGGPGGQGGACIQTDRSGNTVLVLVEAEATLSLIKKALQFRTA